MNFWEKSPILLVLRQIALALGSLWKWMVNSACNDVIKFMDMEDTIATLLACALIAAAMFGMVGGRVKAYGEQKKILRTVLSILDLIIGGIAVVWGLLPGILLFFTLQWGPLLTILFYAAVVAVLFFGISYALAVMNRRRKYRRNPLMREAVTFCRKNGIVAVQCFADQLRFFTDLENEEYCRKYEHTHFSCDQSGSATYQKTWSRPAAWQAYDHPASLQGVLNFSSRGYENIPDLELFAKVLASRLGGFAVVAHTQFDQYDTVKEEPGKKITTHHITRMYDDRFVYSKKIFRKKFPPQPKPVLPKPASAPKPRKKSWE